MSEAANYIHHISFTPPFYHRRFEFDLDFSDTDAKRVTLIVLPFLSLYRPLGSLISLGMGGMRCICHLSGAMHAKRWGEGLWQVMQLAFAVMALVAAWFSFKLGLLAVTGFDILRGAAKVMEHLLGGRYQEALDEMLQVVSSGIYLGIMLTGLLEVILVSALIQALISFYQARKEWAQGRYPEAIAKFAFGWIRLYQAGQTVQQLQRRNFLLKMAQYRDLQRRAWRAKEVRHLWGREFLKKEEAVLGGKKIGAHFHGYGKALVKGDNLEFREGNRLDFKVNHVFRDKLEQLIRETGSLDAGELKEFLSFSGSQVENIRVSEVEYPLGKGYQITLEGLGKIFVGSSDDFPNLYDRVTVQMDEGKNVFDLHELMSFMDLDDALRASTEEDLMRLKMGHLFHTFSPREALFFERSEEFFNLPLDQLKDEMIKRAPEMGEVFTTYLDQLQPHEMLPGKVRYQIAGLAEEAYGLGARALTAGITGVYGDEKLYERIASILEMGMLSSETRASFGMQEKGMSSWFDFYTGGADSVFTQLLTEKNCNQNMPLWMLHYYSKVQMLISLEALETGTYQYHDDSFGTRKVGDWLWDEYLHRPSIREFVQEEQTSGWFHGGNEVMIKERIPPDFIKGLIVPDRDTYEGLLAHLRSREVVQLGIEGQETIFGVSVDKFIRIGTRISEELIA